LLWLPEVLLPKEENRDVSDPPNREWDSSKLLAPRIGGHWGWNNWHDAGWGVAGGDADWRATGADWGARSGDASQGASNWLGYLLGNSEGR
jgi:hypothetical protein